MKIYTLHTQDTFVWCIEIEKSNSLFRAYTRTRNIPKPIHCVSVKIMLMIAVRDEKWSSNSKPIFLLAHIKYARGLCCRWDQSLKSSFQINTFCSHVLDCSRKHKETKIGYTLWWLFKQRICNLFSAISIEFLEQHIA